MVGLQAKYLLSAADTQVLSCMQRCKGTLEHVLRLTHRAREDGLPRAGVEGLPCGILSVGPEAVGGCSQGDIAQCPCYSFGL